MNAQIAQHLNITEAAILKIEEWASVLFCVIKGVGARFVSKKVIKEMQLTQNNTTVTDGTFSVYYGVEFSRYGNVIFDAAQFGLKPNTMGKQHYNFDLHYDKTVQGELRERLVKFADEAKAFFDAETKRIEDAKFQHYLEESKTAPAIDVGYEMYNPNGRYFG